MDMWVTDIRNMDMRANTISRTLFLLPIEKILANFFGKSDINDQIV